MYKGHRIKYLPTGQLANAARPLRKVLKAPEENEIVNRVTSGRVDARRAYRALKGQRDIRKQRFHRAGYTTVVSLLIDNSASMTRHAPVLQAATRAIGKLLHQCGNPFAIYGFQSESEDCHEHGGLDTPVGVSKGHHPSSVSRLKTLSQRGDEDDGGTFTTSRYDDKYNNVAYGAKDQREWGCNLCELKGFKESWPRVDTVLSTIHRATCDSDTPDARAIVAAADMTARHRGDRHIMLVLTDGAGYGRDYVKVATEYANSIGVETVGICFNSGHVTEGDGQYNASIEVAASVHDSFGHTDGETHVVPEANALSKGFFAGIAKQLTKGNVRKRSTIS